MAGSIAFQLLLNTVNLFGLALMYCSLPHLHGRARFVNAVMINTPLCYVLNVVFRRNLCNAYLYGKQHGTSPNEYFYQCVHDG
jgi:hypothetical protein